MCPIISKYVKLMRDFLEENHDFKISDASDNKTPCGSVELALLLAAYRRYSEIRTEEKFSLLLGLCVNPIYMRLTNEIGVAYISHGSSQPYRIVRQ